MNINEFADHLKRVRTAAAAQGQLDKYLRQFGIRSYAFTYYSKHVKTGRKLKYEFASDALRPWHDYYLEQGYADVDRTLEKNFQMTLPLFWQVKTQLGLAKNKREFRIREESIEFGIDKGLSIPVHGPNQDFITLTLHQRSGETCLKNYLVHQFEWQSAAMIFYHYFKKLLPTTDKVNHYHLTRREQQCLNLVAKGWRIEEIAKELHISGRTVNFHLQNVNKKLGTHSKYQAILKYFQQ